MADQLITQTKKQKKAHKKRLKKGVPTVPPTTPQPEWYKLSIEEVQGRLESGPTGLSDAEAAKRLKKYGHNEIVEKKKTPAILQFLKQFTDVLIIILLVATAVSAVLGEYIDAGAILAIVILNAVMGFIHERKAEKAVEALKKMLVPKAKVLRDGSVKIVESRSLVPGDVLILEAGERITADCRIMEALHLKVNESVLTGESVPVEKELDVITETATIPERKNSLFSGTTAVYGHCRAIVTSTGMETEFGKIATLLQAEEKESTPLQKRLERLGKFLGIIILVICAAIFGTGLARAGLGNREELITLFLTAVALAVAAIPEALPAVVTVALATGLTRMAKKNAIVRRLAAVETLGSATAICTDKTGTLTVNEMTVRKIFVDGKVLDVTGKGYDRTGEFLNDDQKVAPAEDLKLLLETGLLCNNAVLGKEPVGDPTELALLVSASKAGLPDLRKYHERVDEIPFDSDRKKMSVICTADGKIVMHMKGAVEKVLDNCTHIHKDGRIEALTQEDINQILEVNHLFAVDALRVLAFARKELKPGEHHVEKGLVFLGLQGMIDPPRPEVKEAYLKCREAGLRVVMITGDHKDTAAAVAREIGIIDDKGTVLTGTELDALGDEEYARVAPEVRVYARVSPQHKVRITDTHKRMGHVVAMTGDGINDAPALKRSNIGVAMGVTGTDVTKEASDMVLTDDNFATIVAAVEEGRGIYENIRKSVYYLLCANVAEVVAIFAAVLLDTPLPLLPVQLLWINLVAGGLPALALGVEPYEREIMKRPPRDPREGIITRDIPLYLVSVGFVVAAATLSLFYLGITVEEARTVAFTFFVVVKKLIAYNFRTFGPSHKVSFLSNKQLLIACAISFPLQAAIVYVPFLNPVFHTVPLPWWDWLEIIGASFAVFWLVEGIKALLRHFERAARRPRPPKRVLKAVRVRREEWPGERWVW
jgi:Ca2+-transporting ATPase